MAAALDPKHSSHRCLLRLTTDGPSEGPSCPLHSTTGKKRAPEHLLEDEQDGSEHGLLPTSLLARLRAMNPVRAASDLRSTVEEQEHSAREQQYRDKDHDTSASASGAASDEVEHGAGAQTQAATCTDDEPAVDERSVKSSKPDSTLEDT